jgi:hypothetical protein
MVRRERVSEVRERRCGSWGSNCRYCRFRFRKPCAEFDFGRITIQACWTLVINLSRARLRPKRETQRQRDKETRRQKAGKRQREDGRGSASGYFVVYFVLRYEVHLVVFRISCGCFLRHVSFFSSSFFSFLLFPLDWLWSSLASYLSICMYLRIRVPEQGTYIITRYLLQCGDSPGIMYARTYMREVSDREPPSGLGAASRASS